MNDEIKRILRLSTIEGFILAPWEEKLLEEWKASQVDVKPKKVKKENLEEGIGSDNKITVKTKVKNVVEEKTK